MSVSAPFFIIFPSLFQFFILLYVIVIVIVRARLLPFSCLKFRSQKTHDRIPNLKDLDLSQKLRSVLTLHDSDTAYTQMYYSSTLLVPLACKVGTIMVLHSASLLSGFIVHIWFWSMVTQKLLVDTYRRTLSPVPRGGNTASVEVSSVGSPLSRFSSSPHSPASSLDPRAFMLGVFSPRSLRALDKSKPKGQLWRKVLLHFFISFLVGVSIGFISFASRNLSTSLKPKQQAFFYEMISAARNLQPFEDTKISATPSISEAMDFNATLNSSAKEQKLKNEVADNIFNNQLLGGKPDLESHKLLIIVTPTFTYQLQAYYLHRLAQTLKLVPPPLLWIVVEMTSQSEETAEILRNSGIMYRHLICKSNISNPSHRSILQRNVALTHIETHRLDGIVYFADDGNIYSVELFQQMREIRRFGTWIVAKLSGNKSSTVLQGPICNGSRVVGWHINEPNWRSKRFHAEMSGFAFNSTIIWDPKRWHRPTLEPIRQLDTVREGFSVSTLIEQLVEDESQMEGLMNNCSSVMVWHNGLESSDSFYPQKWIIKNNLDIVLPLPGDSR